ncbi:hypothetical protein OPV22_017083 [Ensete ventricosum]|uniref:Uncharacterized protein n=1 Tax=Ensete ventricosum TaxID=4639 RepID=A0AAV8QVI1_ENSVE|nr:hypothetical protein OPV22_017083 [Ensete ventricosum]
MSSLRNAIPQPRERNKNILCRLREKTASRNPDEFSFKMVNTRMVGGIHRPKSEANKYTPEELMLMKTQDVGYVLQKVQSEKKKIERLNSAFHTLDHQPENKNVEEAKEIQSRQFEKRDSLASVKVPVVEAIYPDEVLAASYRELEARQKRVQDLEKLYSDMALPKELQKSGRKHKLRGWFKEINRSIQRTCAAAGTFLLFMMTVLTGWIADLRVPNLQSSYLCSEADDLSGTMIDRESGSGLHLQVDAPLQTTSNCIHVLSPMWVVLHLMLVCWMRELK